MHARRRKVAGRDEAEALLSEWDVSGMELVEFCRVHGVDARSLHCWRLNLTRRTREPGPSQALRLVELTLPVHRATYRLEVDGIHIEVDDDFNEDTLARLLRVARAC